MPGIFTYSDCVDHGIDFLGGTPDALAQRDVRRAVQQAYRELINVKIWTYLYSHDRVITNPPYLTGTVAYNQTGGQYERELLLYQGVWPAWTGPGCKVRIGVVTHEVQERKSDTILTFTSQVNPGMDIDYNPHQLGGITLSTPIAIGCINHGLSTGDTVIIEGVQVAVTETPMAVINAVWTVTVVSSDVFSLNGSSGSGLGVWDGISGTFRLPPTTTYVMYQDDYLLPADFIKSDTAIYEGNFGGLTYSDPTDQLWFNRFTYSAGTPRFYTLKGSPLFLNRLEICFWPYPDVQKTIDFIYQRRSRDLRWESYQDGSVTVAGALATGNGTAFDPSMAGSVLRTGTSSSLPTSWVGTMPPVQELQIAEVVSPTQLRLLDAGTAQSAVLYSISDPVDVEPGAMLTALLRGIEKQLSIARRLSTENQADPLMAYSMALKEAMAADSRSYQGRSMGGQRPRWIAPKYMPAQFFPPG